MSKIAKVTKSAHSGQGAELKHGGNDGVLARVLSQFGTAYKPNDGALCVTIPVSGDDGNSFAIVTEPKDMGLADGESAIGNFDGGAYLIFRNSGLIEVVGNIQHNGNTIQTGNTTSSGVVQSASVITGVATIGGKDFATHKHSGVQTGSGQTGGVV